MLSLLSPPVVLSKNSRILWPEDFLLHRDNGGHEAGEAGGVAQVPHNQRQRRNSDPARASLSELLPLE